MRTRFSNPRKRRLSDISALCFGTSVATLAAAAVGYAVDKLVTPWPMTTLLVVVSAFFFAQGLWHLLGQALQKPRPALDVAESRPLAGHLHAIGDASEIGRGPFQREAASLATTDRDQQFVRV